MGNTQKPPIFVEMPKNTLGNSQSMTKEQWNALKTAQIEAFYRKMGQTLPEPEKPQNSAILDDFDDYFNS